MPIKVYQNIINQVKDVIRSEFGVINSEGVIVASSNEEKTGTSIAFYDQLLSKHQDIVHDAGFTYRRISIKKKVDGFTYIEGSDELSKNYLELLTANIINVKSYHDDKFDKYYFLKSVLLDNVLPGDVYLRARELKLEQNAIRVVYLIQASPKFDKTIFDFISLQFPDREKDFVIQIDDGQIVFIRDLKEKIDHNEIVKVADKLVASLESAKVTDCLVGIGTIVDSLRDIGRSFREAQMSLQIGETFIGGKKVYNYNSLGIGRLIFQMPKTLCKLFLKEVFHDEVFREIDDETMATVKIFFDNNLNVSETSRQLYVHRNTLVYRLDKIQKLTGLDLRMFDDAITFKVAMLVKKFLDYHERQ